MTRHIFVFGARWGRPTVKGGQPVGLAAGTYQVYLNVKRGD